MFAKVKINKMLSQLCGFSFFFATLNMQWTLSFKKANIRTISTFHLQVPKTLTFESRKQQSVDDKLVPRKKLWRKATWIFCRVNDVLSSLLESSQGFVAHSQRLFELSHQWRIKGCVDDRGSIKSRSLEDEGGEGNNIKKKICRMAGSQVLPDWDWKLPYVCSSLPHRQWTRSSSVATWKATNSNVWAP